jgi:unsaturated rhamnogalacturonyl hydrolase
MRTIASISLSAAGAVVSLLGCATAPAPVASPPPPLEETSAAASPAPAAESAPSAVANAEVSNPSSFARPKCPLYFRFHDLGLAADDERTSFLAVKADDSVIPSQAIDDDGDGKKDTLLTLVDLGPTEQKSLSIVTDRRAVVATSPKLTQAEISHKVGGEWRPRKDKPELKEYVGGTFKNVDKLRAPAEHTDHSKFIRYEGPGIESDLVAYRVYLDWRNGFDIFGKKVTTPVLQGIGQDGFESYHHMAPWGMDILKVGQSLGAGGFGFWKNKKVELVSDVQSWEATIVENGNLYSAFRIDYGGWKVDGKKVDVSATFSMTGGSRLVRTRIELSEELPNLAVGLVKHEGVEAVQGSTDVTGRAYTYTGSHGKQSLNGDQLGMAVLMQQGTRQSQETDKSNFATVVEPEGKKAEYFFVAAWEGEPGAPKNKADFVQYLERETEALTIPPRVRLKTARSLAAKTEPISAERALEWAKKLADSELARKTLSYRQGGWDENRGRKPKFEYDIVGLQPLAYDVLYEVAPDPRYKDVIEKVTGSYVTDAGEVLEYTESEYNIDSINPGRNLLRLYERTKAEKYKKATEKLRKQLQRHPKTSEGAFWHKKKYPFQLWLDGVYMGMPFLAGYSALFEQGKSFDEVVNEFVVTRRHLRNEATGLYFHAWDEKKKQSWADPKTGLSKEYWGRGLGWYAMALVDVLDIIPENDEKRRKPLLEMVRELGPALARYQDPETGTWYQVLDKPTAPGNYRESSASAMFTYFLAKAVRKGYLPKEHRAVAEKAFAGLVNEFITVHADGTVSMTHQCLVGGLGFGRDGSYRYYMTEPIWQNDPKGNGPFILAGVELYRLLKG